MPAVTSTPVCPLLPRRMSLFALDLPVPEFVLDDDFLEDFRDRPVSWGPVGWVTYKRTYSRHQDSLRIGGAHRTVPVGDSEQWWQTVARVVEGTYQIQQRHCVQNHLHWRADKAQRSAREMYRRIFEFKFLPPGRGLWMMGTEFIKQHGSTALNNCGFVSTASVSSEGLSLPFTALMDWSMLGVGVGFDTEGAGTIDIVEPDLDGDVHVVTDDREGWVRAVRRVLDAYTGSGALPSVWDYSLVRPAGSPIRGFGGTAAGPAPLQALLEVHLPRVLGDNVGSSITSTTIVDIGNVIAKCVVSGNVRRSAEIAFGSPDDADFLDLKNPDVAPSDAVSGGGSWRFNSNNSVMASVGMDYTQVASRVIVNGEPGLFWLDNARAYGRLADPPDYADSRVAGANPCVEQSLEHFELCCLVETFPAHHDDYEDFEDTLKLAYLYAKTATLLPTHDYRANAVMMRNRRIGTSQSGVVENFRRVGRREHFRWCDRGYRYLRDLDQTYSEWLAVPRSVKITSIKPSGTVSKLCGATSGMHRPPSEFYVQRIRFSNHDPLVPVLREAGYRMEACVNGTVAQVVDFPVRQKNFERAEYEVSAAVQLGDAAALQRYWSDNQVSCTVKFDAARESDSLVDLLELYEDQLKGISFLPYTLELGEGGLPSIPYDQAPWQPITEAEYQEMVAELRPIRNVRGDTHVETDRGCDSDRCVVIA